MRTEDIKKLKKAGYTILRAFDYPKPGIVSFELGEKLLVNILSYSEDTVKSVIDGYWDDLKEFETKEARDRALAKMLEDDKTLLD